MPKGATSSAKRPEALRIALHPKQWVAFGSAATEVLYGGAAGGGKSHLMRQAAISWCAEIAGLQVYLFRRIREDLSKSHMEGAVELNSVRPYSNANSRCSRKYSCWLLVRYKPRIIRPSFPAR